MEKALIIRSRSNPRIRLAAAVLAGKERSLVALEGERLVRDALDAGLELELLLVAPERSELAEHARDRALEFAWVDAEVLARTSALEHSPGALALVRSPPRRALDTLELDERTLLLVLAGIADPGNLGALARSAEAFGAAGICPIGGADPLGSKALRGSMGSFLRLPIYGARSSEEAARELARLGLRQVAAATRGGTTERRFDWSGPLALWIAAETGAAPPCFERFETVTIPMAGAVESLNVTVAASLLLHAARRGNGANG